MIDQILALEMTTYLQNEIEYVPWKSAIGNLAYIEGMLSKTGLYGLFEVDLKSNIYHFCDVSCEQYSNVSNLVTIYLKNRKVFCF